jgi:hypothetical protein
MQIFRKAQQGCQIRNLTALPHKTQFIETIMQDSNKARTQTTNYCGN